MVVGLNVVAFYKEPKDKRCLLTLDLNHRSDKSIMQQENAIA